MNHTRIAAICLGWFLSGLFSTASAGVVRFEIDKREPFAGGQSFGDVGPYEKIAGRVVFAIDPALRQNQTIVDLQHAPRNKQGLVEFSGDLCIVAPVDPRRGNGALVYDVNNRGNKLAIRFFNHGDGGNAAADAGDGFLMRQGFTIVWSGWDGELLPGGDRMRLYPPIARQNGQTITGLVRCELVPLANTSRSLVVNWDNHGSYRPTSAGLKNATLTVRSKPELPRQPIPRDQFTVHVIEIPNEHPSQLPKVEIEAAGGLKAGQIYELIYEAQDPLVHGICFASVRDLISALKHGDGEGNPFGTSPPLTKGGQGGSQSGSDARSAPHPQSLSPKGRGEFVFSRAHGFGVSQSGRFLREFLYSGFNEDERGQKVFDGLIPHVSGSGLGSFNHRFAQPTRHCNQHDHHDYPADRFPFGYGTIHDSLSGQTDGILRRAAATNTVPCIMHTQSAGEYWTRSGSLTHTDPTGQRDVAVPDCVRIYLFGGTQHGPAGFPPSRGQGQNLANPGDYKPYLRALLLALDRWCREGTCPPPSVFPTIADGTLVPWDQASTRFPEIPGVRYPTIIQQPPLLDWGPRWDSERIADHQPPKIRGTYTVRVPVCGPDGNELGCLSPPEVAVPLATFTGWNPRNKESGAENQLMSLTGSYIPFATTRAERQTSGDPRPSLEERYGSLDKYIDQLRSKCRDLETGGYLLPEDTERVLRLQSERAKPLFK